MIRWVSVKTFQRAAGFQLLNLTGFRKYLKVAIDRSQADTRQSLANDLIDLIRTGMGVNFTKLLQNYLTLTRHPKVRVLLQTVDASC